MIILTATFFLCYCLLISAFIMAFSNVIRKDIRPADNQKFITVVVAVRNEEKNIALLLEDLKAQHYSEFEVIIVNDHSDDRTEEIVRDFDLPNVKFVVSKNTGKKHAITTGINLAKGAIIATTDGDCRLPPLWLKSINGYFQDEKTMMAVGAVKMDENPGIFSKLQQIEFASLIGSAGATLAMGFPTMCNGANLAFRKEIFFEVNGYAGNTHIPSGDDEFLMRKIYDQYPKGIQFLANKHAVVITAPQQDLKSFFMQRLRWAAKWRFNSSVKTILLAVFILLIQAFTILCYFKFIQEGNSWWIILIGVKALFDGMFLFRICRFLKIKWSWFAFFLLQILYPLYVVGVGLTANFLTYSWKGRNYSSR